MNGLIPFERIIEKTAEIMSPSPKTITTAYKQNNYKLTRATTLLIEGDESKKVQSLLSNTTEIHPPALFLIGCLNNWVRFIKWKVYIRGGGGGWSRRIGGRGEESLMPMLIPFFRNSSVCFLIR